MPGNNTSPYIEEVDLYSFTVTVGYLHWYSVIFIATVQMESGGIERGEEGREGGEEGRRGGGEEGREGQEEGMEI